MNPTVVSLVLQLMIPIAKWLFSTLTRNHAAKAEAERERKKILGEMRDRRGKRKWVKEQRKKMEEERAKSNS